MKRNCVILLSAWLCASLSTYAFDVAGFTADQTLAYKQTVNGSGEAVTLHLEVFTPPDHQPADSRPVIVFFHGGGWSSGSTTQFHPHCKYLASRGMVAISAEYRLTGVHGTTPQESVTDGKSAIRWVRNNASTLGIDPNKVIAGGGSAGGHIAAAAGTLTNYDEAAENSSTSSKPNALVLFNPVFDNGPTGYGYNKVQAYWEDFSPLHNIDETAPPTTVFLGTRDEYIPVDTTKGYQALMRAKGLRCDLHLYEDQVHGFFNYGRDGYENNIFRMDEFLVSLGYLTHPHADPDPVSEWVKIFGDTSFSGMSATTSSPVTTDADGDGIAAHFTDVSLADGQFIRMTGSVTFDTPLSGSNFRIGLFEGDNPVTEDDGNGYVGIWAEAPATAATKIAAGDGTGTNHPFETATSLILGPVPAADAMVPTNTPIEFTLMIARNGNNLDISTNFTDHGTYDQSQNLVNQTVAKYNYNCVAFLMTGNLNATQASYSNIEISGGSVLLTTKSDEPAISKVITYVDAQAGVDGNTRESGKLQSDTSWVGIDSSLTNNTQWAERGTGLDNYFQAMPDGDPSGIPQLTTTISGLTDGETYRIWAFFRDNTGDDSSSYQNWVLAAGLTESLETTYWAPNQPQATHNGAPPILGSEGTGTITTSGVSEVFSSDFRGTTPITLVNEGLTSENRLYAVYLGEVALSGDTEIDIYVDMLINGNSSSTRTYYTGVGYELVSNTTFNDYLSNPEFNIDPDERDFELDPDNDGLSNGLEAWFGTHPGKFNVGLTVLTTDGTTTTTIHPQSETPPSDVSSFYEWSLDLVNWYSGDGVDGPIGGLTATIVPSTTGTTTTVTVTVSEEAARIFLRAGVTSN
ncbi:alpha/beta hydrolase [Verrucomicrobiaceae bacterium 5K15]|uniref:Alpha/beta hydrolase n=1 Tax=Oceaniferula flava TaxID=2800421 RepID=A0AAE2VDV1_9BACT|nr:alpha/beta hydrolase [Oceaniferula flavus]MBK1855044.1 alpha/beta hydrolase [Oceaniferula flavus]MBM1136350.1 alpha/beta hydrolase [Oceaniferula flavus]